MENYGIVYGIVGPNKHIYIGSTKDWDRRWYEHLKYFRKGINSKNFQLAWDQNTPDDFRMVILERVEFSQLKKAETKWILIYHKRKHWTVYNDRLVGGGSMPGRPDLTEDGRAIIAATSSKTHKGRSTSIKWREALSVGCKTGGNMARNQSPEIRAQKSMKMKGKPKSNATKLKMKLAQQKRRADEANVDR